jgi:hypothetical protein
MAKTSASVPGQGLIRALRTRVWPEARGPKSLATLLVPAPPDEEAAMSSKFAHSLPAASARRAMVQEAPRATGTEATSWDHWLG